MTARARHSVRLPAGVRPKIRARAVRDGVTATEVICTAVSRFLDQPTTPRTLVAGRLLEHQDLILADGAASTPYCLRMPTELRERLLTRAAADGLTHTDVLVMALAAYLVGEPVEVGAAFLSEYTRLAA